eukprot:COSAG02_NODE_5257_length_4492_cov_6.276121_4_plen_50_part_00
MEGNGPAWIDVEKRGQGGFGEGHSGVILPCRGGAVPLFFLRLSAYRVLQ